MKRFVQFFLVVAVVVTGQAFVDAEQVAFQIEDRPVVTLIEGEVRQTERILEWGFPMSIRCLGYRSGRTDFPGVYEGEWCQPPKQQFLGGWNGFMIAGKEN